MKTLFVPRETHPDETRAPLIPESVSKLTGLGLSVTVESGAGEKADIPDEAYRQAGAGIASERAPALAGADCVVRLRKPPREELAQYRRGALSLSFLDPFNEKDLIGAMAEAGISGVSLEMIPRTTLAQKMDVLSSQANLAGYAAVILAADRQRRILPMMMTPAGTIPPCRVFVIGVGVAGLQAIATAKRLGARVDAFDTRPVVEEQVKSLGAKFLKIDLGETGQTEQGYAQELTPEQLEKQRQGMAKACAQADIVITTAKLFGRRAPTIVSHDMLAGMKKGSIVVDLAVETGGNVEGSKAGEEVVTENGVRIMGPANLEGYYPADASAMFSANVTSFIEHLWEKGEDGKPGDFQWRFDDPILKNCLITHDGAVVHEKFKGD